MLEPRHAWPRWMAAGWTQPPCRSSVMDTYLPPAASPLDAPGYPQQGLHQLAAASLRACPAGRVAAPDLTRQPFRPLFVDPGTVWWSSGMTDGYDNTMHLLIRGLAAQAAAAGGRRSSVWRRAAALSRQTCAQVIN